MVLLTKDTKLKYSISTINPTLQVKGRRTDVDSSLLRFLLLGQD